MIIKLQIMFIIVISIMIFGCNKTENQSSEQSVKIQEQTGKSAVNETAPADAQAAPKADAQAAPTTDAQAAPKADAQAAPEPPKEEKNDAPEIPQVKEELTCSNWNNALFENGKELYYKIKVERYNDSYDDDDTYETSLEFYVLCHVKLNFATDSYCGSTVTCGLDPKYNKDKYREIINPGLPVEGAWFIDRNGYYHFQNNQINNVASLSKSATPGNCTGLKYIKCEEGTLAWEYNVFNRTEPLIPTDPKIKVYESKDSFDDDDGMDGTYKKTVSRTGTVLCYHEAFEGDDEYVHDICIDDVKGPSSFKEVQNGASDFEMKGSLRTK